ncbi:hypothetical protein PR048_004159 [Dryococelus australis]|uniref:Uncharacterized protein n=1 Tax=Dryococelus australis TaxID=614101 RepID=A0ABQ9I4S2_9NEOP|nr:hypothetical protein PR048_004159 [Dryococelus australis]
MLKFDPDDADDDEPPPKPTSAKKSGEEPSATEETDKPSHPQVVAPLTLHLTPQQQPLLQSQPPSLRHVSSHTSPKVITTFTFL